MDIKNNSSEGEKQENFTPEELVRKHMADPSHEFTEEEIKQMEVNPEADPKLKKKEEDKLEELKKEIGKKPVNPYDLLDTET